MTTADDTIQRLTRQARGTGRLAAPADRDKLDAARSEAVPTGSDVDASGIASPLVEQAYTGSTYYSLVSSDGLIVFEYEDETNYIDDGGTGQTLTVQHLDRTP